MSESNSTIGDELLDEARATIERWAADINDAGPDFQTLHMFASYLLAIADRALQQRDQLLEALRELYAADAEFDKRRDGYNPRYATREQIDAYQAAENRRAVAQILAHAAIERAEGRSDG